MIRAALALRAKEAGQWQWAFHIRTRSAAGQVTAIETGILSFEAVFMPFMLTSDGRPLIDRLRGNRSAPGA